MFFLSKGLHVVCVTYIFSHESKLKKLLASLVAPQRTRTWGGKPLRLPRKVERLPGWGSVH